jgi:hypothetical protein
MTRGSLLEHIVETAGTKVIVVTYYCNSGNLGHCWNTLLQQWEPRSMLEHVACCCESSMTSVPIVAAVILVLFWPLLFFSSLWCESTVSLSGYQQSNLLTLPPVMWREERLWNFSVLQEYTFPILLQTKTQSCKPNCTANGLSHFAVRKSFFVECEVLTVMTKNEIVFWVFALCNAIVSVEHTARIFSREQPGSPCTYKGFLVFY